MYGIFTYIWLIYMVNVGTYTSPMDPMGYKQISWESPLLNQPKFPKDQSFTWKYHGNIFLQIELFVLLLDFM